MPEPIKLKLNKPIWNEVERRADKLPILKGSYRGKEGNTIGALGEYLVELWLDAENIPFTAELKQTTHDYRLADGSTFDVKTKDRTVAPRQNYDCSIPLYNADHQKPRFYVFVSLQRNSSNKTGRADSFHTAYILGGITRSKFHKLAKVWDKDEIDPSNGTKFWTACKNVYINQLSSYEDIADYWYLESEKLLKNAA